MPEFRFEAPACPRCGAEVRAIVERLVCYALLQPADDGGHDYADETKLDWDSQHVEVSADGECLLLGVCDHIWLSAFEVPPVSAALPIASPDVSSQEAHRGR